MASANSDPLLPEDVPLVKDARGDGPNEVTWDHPNHGDITTEPLCNVCNGKMSLEEFVSAKVSREGGGIGKKRSKDKSGEGRHKQRHSSRRDKSRSSREKCQSNRDKSQSSKDKGHSSKDKGHSSSSRDKNRHSKSHSSSSKEKRHSSSSKDKGLSSSSKSHSSKDQSHSSPSKHRRHSSSKDVSEASSAAAALAEAEKADLQARINKATAAIEAAKKSGNGLLEQIAITGREEHEEVALLEGPSSPEMELDLPDMDLEVGTRRHSSGADGEVSSTVTIATPEHGEVETVNQEPSVWEGQVIMQDVAKFSVSAYQVSGTSDHLRVDLKNSQTLVGRIPPSVCWDYIDKISKNPTKEILVLRLGPSNNDEKDAYQAFFQYLSTRDR